MYDLIIIGAGPAGLTAALYALRANKKVLVLEARNYGGKIISANKIENYPGIPNISGFDFATNLYSQVLSLGVDFKRETVLRITEDKKVFTTNSSYESKAIIIATGTDNKKLNLNNEESFIGKGISYCATCDGNFYKNKIVAVVGGGSTALEDVLYLSNIAKTVYLIHRNEEFKGDNYFIKEIKNKDNITFVLNTTITQLNGTDKLESIDVKDVNGNTQNIKLDGLFIAVGQEPKNEIFANIIKLDKQGFIISQDGVHTNVSNIYVAGDARQKELRQLTTAVGDGSVAATVAINEMN